jgi:replication factor A2
MNDGTGIIEVKTYYTENPERGDRKFVVGDYARVLGSIKSFGGKRNINAHQVHIVKDFNEIHYHLLEATAVHLHLTRGPPEQFAQAADEKPGTGNPQGVDTTMTGTGYDSEATVYGAQGYGGGYGSGGHSFASENARRVLGALRGKPDQADGLHVNTIAQVSGLTIQDVQKAIDELIDSGSAYTTVDDSHIALIE